MRRNREEREKDAVDFTYFECSSGRLYVPRTLAEVFETMLDPENAVIVEGKKDRAALLELGVKKENIILTAQKTFPEVYETLRGAPFKKLILMLDNDSEGNSEVRMIKREYSFEKRFDFVLRKTLFAHIYGQLENLRRYLERAKRPASEKRI